MTLSYLAKLAQVSVSTVSKAFSDSSEVSAETKAKIIKIAKETGCYEKYYKPIYEKKLIAVICPELLGVHYSQMVSCIERDIAARGGTTLIAVSNFSAKLQAELIDYFIKFAHADGIILIEPIGTLKTNYKIPIVQIALNGDTGNVHSITMEIGDALDEAITLLKTHKHSKIGFVGEQHTENEFEYFEKHMSKNGLPVLSKYIPINDHRFYDCGYYGVDEMLARGKLPTAIFAAYSHVAVGVVQRLHEAHLRIPEDVSVICMDDISISPYNDIDLTCIKMHLSELCKEATHLLYRIFAKRYTISKHTITVKRELHVGKSVSEARRTENVDL